MGSSFLHLLPKWERESVRLHFPQAIWRTLIIHHFTSWLLFLCTCGWKWPQFFTSPSSPLHRFIDLRVPDLFASNYTWQSLSFVSSVFHMLSCCPLSCFHFLCCSFFSHSYHTCTLQPIYHWKSQVHHPRYFFHVPFVYHLLVAMLLRLLFSTTCIFFFSNFVRPAISKP